MVDRVMNNHWGPRYGWDPGRRMWAVYVTFSFNEQIRQIVNWEQAPIRELPGLDLVQPEWLHLSVQGLDFADRVDEQQVQDLLAEFLLVSSRLACPALFIAPPQVDSNAVIMPVFPVEDLGQIKQLVCAIGHRVLERAPIELPGPAVGFFPHVTIGYSNTIFQAAEVTSRLVTAGPSRPIGGGIVSLVRVNREDHTWSWDECKTLA